jgi:hypothetical protein
MSLPYNLQKLPPEAIDVLRYMSTVPSANADTMHDGTGLAQRTVGKVIRRLVTLDYIHVAASGDYELTTDGKIAVKQIAEYDSAVGNKKEEKAKTATFPRRLTVVMPRQTVAGKAADLYIGVNPPGSKDSEKLPGAAHLELKVTAVGGALSSQSISLEVPPDRAATPSRLSLTPAQVGRVVRIRVDIFQSFEFDTVESLGGMYFDVPALAAGSAVDGSTRAVGMDVMLKPPR